MKMMPANGVILPVVKDPCQLQYFRLQPEHATILGALDGVISLRQLKEKVQEQHVASYITIRDIQAVILDLFMKQLLISERQEQGWLLLQQGRRKKWETLLKSLSNPLFLQLPGWEPGWMLAAAKPLFGWLFWRGSVILMLFFISFSWLFAFMRYDSVQERIPEFQQFFGPGNLPWLWLSIAFCKTFHELGHGLCCTHFGARCHSMGIMLMLFSPTMYCDVSDSWLLRDKWKRIAIGAAGIYFEAILSSIAILLWWNTRPGLINYLALNMFFVSAFTTVVFNANPFLRRFDGYYMFSDWVEVPNLRERADLSVKSVVNRLLLGRREMNVRSPDGKLWILSIYAVAARCYGLAIYWSIVLIIYRWLTPYHLSSPWLFVTVCFACWSLLKRTKEFLKQLAPAIRGDTTRWRLYVLCTLIVIAVIGFFLIPVPWSVSAPLYLEPRSITHVLAPADGVLHAVHVRPGQYVEAGMPIAEILDPTLEEEVLRLENERDVAAARVAQAAALEDADDHLIALEQKAAAERELAKLQSRLSKLEVRAPISGVVVEAATRRSSPVNSNQRLEEWSGTPLSPGNEGLLLRKQSLICAIAPESEYLSILLVDQMDRRLIENGNKVSITLDHLPWESIEGVVESISAEPASDFPQILATRFGGTLATDPSQEAAALSVAYPAMVRFQDGANVPLLTELRGTARMQVRGMSLSDWVWHVCRKTLLFDL